jgi:hypothetical protein
MWARASARTDSIKGKTSGFGICDCWSSAITATSPGGLLFVRLPYSNFPTQRQNIERRVVKRAWNDAEFRARLLEDPKSALEEELGVELPERLRVSVVEEQPDHLCIVLPVDTSRIIQSTVDVMMGVPPRRRQS